MASTDLATAFTYQGFLSNNGNPVTSPCDFEFRLYDALNAGSQLGSTQTVSAVSVTGGVFTVTLNGAGQFGAGVFDGNDRYLDISVRCPAGSGLFTQLLPRSPITSSPSALFAANATNATIAAGLNGLTIQQNATSPNLIGGFSSNTVLTGVVGATIGGGGVASHVNSITDNYATVGGGYENRAGDGDADTTNNRFSTVAGGAVNTAGGAASFIGGGEENVAASNYSTVSGGLQNQANGQFSVVPGGIQNISGGDFSFAAGRRAKANAAGSFVWADSTDADMPNNTANSFVVRASGGFTFYTNAGATTGASIAAGSGTWSDMSDQTVKENFAAIDPMQVLENVINMPISSWNYIAQGDSVRHLGPMAQDFYAAFGLGEDDRHISTVDSGGVALAAIQGLYQVVQDKDAQIAALQTENAELKTRLDDLDQRLAALEALAAPSQAGLSLPVMLAGIVLAGGLSFAGRRILRKDAFL